MTKSPVGMASKLSFGAAWDRKQGKQSRWQRKLAEKTGGKLNLGGGEKDIDLDLAVVLYRDSQAKRVAIGHNQDPTKTGKVWHSGDNQTGQGDGDDETAGLDIGDPNFPAWVDGFAVIVAAYKPGTTFDHAQNVSLNVYADGHKVDELMPTLGSGHNACVIMSGTKDTATGAWSWSVVDHSGRMTAQGDESAILAFAKQHAGI
jgi:stress response protein SCP2